MRKNSKLWVPSTGEERYLNLLALGLVLLLLALGFEILKLPASIAPDRPPLPQFVGLVALLMLGLVITWVAARDDYVRFSYGFPRVLATFTLVTLSFTGAFLMRGWWDGTYVVDLSTSISARQAATVLIGGQFAALAFFSTYLLKKGDTTAVRSFKKSAAAIRTFAKQLSDGKLAGDKYESAYGIVAPELAAIAETARGLNLVIEADEARFATGFGEASKKIGTFLETASTAGITQTVANIRRNDSEALAILAGKSK